MGVAELEAALRAYVSPGGGSVVAVRSHDDPATHDLQFAATLRRPGEPDLTLHLRLARADADHPGFDPAWWADRAIGHLLASHRRHEGRAAGVA